MIYAETQGIGRSYELARHYAPFFTDYFACLGYALTVSHRDQMVSLSPAADAPRHDIVSERLRKDETLVLLALRLLYEEGLRDHRAGTDGIVDCTTDEIVEKIRAVARNEPPRRAGSPTSCASTPSAAACASASATGSSGSRRFRSCRA